MMVGWFGRTLVLQEAVAFSLVVVDATTLYFYVAFVNGTMIIIGHVEASCDLLMYI